MLTFDVFSHSLNSFNEKSSFVKNFFLKFLDYDYFKARAKFFEVDLATFS